LALNKRKVLEAARKHAQKGAKAKALKEYNKLLKEDPRDAKLLLEVGDAYRRWGQNEEAIAQYGKVAQQYRQDGFDARAVAVFKQILNLDSKNYAAYVSLSELYQRMGLDSEAVGALQTAADGYHKEGRKAEALDLLRQMAALDPTNTTSRLKVAELLRQEGMESEAVTEYQAVAAELETQQDRDQLITVLERLLEVKGDDVGALTTLVRQLMDAGEFSRAEPLAVRALNADTDAPQYELLMDLYAQMGDESKLADATRGLAKLFRDRGDEERARELMQRLPAEEMAATTGSRLAVDVSEAEVPDLEDEELLDDDDEFLPLDDEMGADASPELDLGEGEPALDLGSDDSELSLDLEDEAPPEAAAEAVAEVPLPEGDPDQLLAEASVYLRYGKRDQAIASLRGILAQDPDHRPALEKLGEAYVDDGQNSEAVQVWLRAAEQMRVCGDAESLSVLRDRIAALDPVVAEQIGEVDLSAQLPEVPEAPPAEALVEQDTPVDLDLDLDLDLEVDLDLDDAMEDVEANHTQAALDFGTEPDDFMIELDDDSITFDGPPAVDSPEGAETETTEEASLEFEVEVEAEGLSLDDDSNAADVSGDVEFDLDADEEHELGGEVEMDVESALADDVSAEFDFDGGELTSPPTASAAGQSTTTTARIAEELEEAEFYLAQSMYDEAEGLLQRILDIVPNHPSALLRMGEIAAARGGEPDDAVSQTNMAVSAEPAVDFEITARFDDDTEDLAAADDEDATQSEIDAASDDVGDEVTFEIDVDFDDDVGLNAESVEAADEDSTETNLSAVSEASEESPLKLTSEESSTTEFVADSEDDSDVELEVDDDVDVDVEMDVGGEAIEDEAAVEEPAEEESDGVAAAVAEEAAPAVEVEATADEAVPVDAAESFDLREALADVLDEDEPLADSNGESGVLSTVEDGFESIFSDFKKGVTATLDEGDFDTRYDLGIAYREMGLYEDAIGEFRVCLDSEARRFDSLYLMGICARDLGRFDDSVNHLEQALALPDLPESKMAGVYFDLAVAEECSGNPDRACISLRRVVELEPEFPGAAAMLERLEAAELSSPELGEPGEVFESFDELFDEDADDEEGDGALAASASVETFESFDDVMSEAEAALDDADFVAAEEVESASEGEAVVEVEAEADSDTNEDTQTVPRKGGRKKISFV